MIVSETCGETSFLYKKGVEILHDIFLAFFHFSIANGLVSCFLNPLVNLTICSRDAGHDENGHTQFGLHTFQRSRRIKNFPILVFGLRKKKHFFQPS